MIEISRKSNELELENEDQYNTFDNKLANNKMFDCNFASDNMFKNNFASDDMFKNNLASDKKNQKICLNKDAFINGEQVMNENANEGTF